MPALFWATDQELRLAWVQGSALYILDLKPDELKGLNLSDCLKRRGSDRRFLDAHQRALEGESSRFEAAWGERRFEAHIEPLLTPEGKIRGTIGVAREISSRKEPDSPFYASDRRFRALIENSSEMLSLVGADGTFLYVSPSTTRIMGYPQEELLGRNALELIHPEESEQTRAQLADLVSRPEGMVSTQFRMLRKDGSWRCIEATGLNLLAEPSIQAIVANYRDITERRRADEALRQSEARYRIVAETATDAFFTIGTDSRIHFANAAAERIFGYSREEMLGQDPQMIMPGYLRVLHKEGTPHDPESGKRHINWESVALLGLHKSGKEIPVEVSLSEFISGGQHVFTAIVRDITQRKRSEEALRFAEEKYRSIVENAVEGIFQTTREGGYVSVNPALARMYGYDSPRELMESVTDIGRQVYVTPQARSDFKRLMEENDVVTGFEYQVYRRDGSKMWLTENARAVRDAQGKLLYYEGTVEDITEAKRAEAERQVMFEIIREINATANLDELFRRIHASLRKVLAAENCFVALQDPLTGLFHFPFFVDECDAPPPPMKMGRSCTAYVFRTGRPALVTPRAFERLVAEGEVELVGTPSPAWLGVPLRTPSRTIGALVVQHYKDEHAYSERDLEFLASVGGQIALVIERRQAEEALRASEASFRLLFENNPMPTWVFDLDTLQFLQVNDAAVEHYGYSREEFLRMKSTDIRPAEDVSQFMAELGRDRSPHDSPAQWRHRCKDGRLIDVEITSHNLEFDGRRAAVVVVTDITERRRAEEALRRSEANYRSLFQGSPYGIYRIAAGGKLLDVNPALVEMLGYSSEAELLAVDPDKDIFRDPEQQQRLMRDFPERMDGVEVAWKRRDGIPITVRLSGRLVREIDGSVSCYETIAENVTEQRLLEHQLRQAQKMEAVGRLAGGVAHDFNNLLMVIKGHTELLLDRVRTDDWHFRKVEQIDKAADRAAALTRQLLAFSRMQILQPKVMDLNAVVGEMGKLLPRVIGEDIELTILSGSRLCRVKADPGQIEQVILNLAVNARDAMPRGGKLVIETSNVELDEAYARRHPPVVPGRFVLLTVSDTGTGMDSETLAHIFEPFFTTKEKGKGTGLGLATVYGVVKQSGGFIWVYSEPGKGSTFKIYLPPVEESAEPARPPHSAAEAPQGTETILLAEDERDVREVASEFLSLCGYTVLEAKNGAQAVEIATQHSGPIHLLVTDMVMPGMGGRELAARLKTVRPETKVIYMSGYTEYATVRQGDLQEDDILLTKPFTRSMLARAVRELLQEKKPQ